MEEVIKPTTSFSPLVVISFNDNVKRCAIEWLIAKIEGRKNTGCAELNVHVVENKHNGNTLLYIGASTERLLKGAEEMHFKKLDKDGLMVDFTLTSVHNFVGSDDFDTFLSESERQRILLHELESVRATTDDTHIPGYDHVTLTSGRSVVRKYINQNIARNFFPLHNDEVLESLCKSLYTSLSSQPINTIRDYFGENIGLYFAFLGMYTHTLIPPCVIAILFSQWYHPISSAVFALFNLVWATLFLEMWKRRCAELAYTWGTFRGRLFEEPRAAYHGITGYNAVTGKPEQVYPKWKRLLRYYCVSVPVILVCLNLSYHIMLWYFWMQEHVDRRYKRESDLINYLLVFSPTAAYAVVIAIVNGIYRKVAHFLNSWENHRLQSSFDNHLIFKLVVFDFVNSFSSLFYVAFYYQDMNLLRSHLGALLITQQIIGQLREAFVPFLLFRFRARHLEKRMKESYHSVTQVHDHVDLHVIKSANRQCAMDVYEGTLDDYLEMFLQFGYVFLFSSAFPLAAVCAFLNNLTEIRSDAFKMCRIFQRPFAQPSADIGAWQVAFEALGAIAVMTNCALIGMNPEVRKLLPHNLTVVHIMLVFVATEHLILLVKWFICYIIPDVPKWVQLELGKIDYRSTLALLKQRQEDADNMKEIKTE